MQTSGVCSKRGKTILKIGVILPEEDHLSDWHALCLENLHTLPQANIQVLFKINRLPRARYGSAGKPSSCIRHLLFVLYYRHIRHTFKIRDEDLPPWYKDIPVLNLTAESPDGSQDTYLLTEEDRQKIKELGLDIILAFTRSVPGGMTEGLSREGILFFRFSDESRYPGKPPCFWEIYNRDHITVASLCKLADGSGSLIILRKGYFRTVSYSYRQNLAQCYRACSFWPAQVCNDIINRVRGHHETAVFSRETQTSRLPGNITMLWFGIKIAGNILLKTLSVLFRHEQWNIGICASPIEDFLEPGFKPQITWSPFVSKQAYLADPFAINENGKITVFCEEYDYASGKGSIASFPVEEEEKFLSSPRTVLEMPVHMSYPYIFEYDNTLYCVPETLQNREICLYRASGFPVQWLKAHIIIGNVAAVDPTVVFYQGLWWLFFTDNDIGDDLHLFIYYAEKPPGPWKPHNNNPVKSDVRSTRPAGTPFTFKGNLYRPAQDCSQTYGGRTIINRVIHLSPNEFFEEAAAVVEPDMNSVFRCGLHTLARAGNCTVVDGKRWIYSFHECRRYARRIFRRDWQ